MTVPYTYRVWFRHPTENYTLHYYGVRYAEGCHPDDLFNPYITSSKRMKALLKEYDRSCFIWKVRRTFSSKKEAVAWESKVLVRINAAKRSDFINRSNGASGFYSVGSFTTGHLDKLKQYASTRPDSHNKNISKAKKNRPLSEKNKKAISAAMMAEKNHFFGKKHTDEAKAIMKYHKTGDRHPCLGRKRSKSELEAISCRVQSPDGTIYESKREVFLVKKVLTRRQLERALTDGTWRLV